MVRAGLRKSPGYTSLRLPMIIADFIDAANRELGRSTRSTSARFAKSCKCAGVGPPLSRKLCQAWADKLFFRKATLPRHISGCAARAEFALPMRCKLDWADLEPIFGDSKRKTLCRTSWCSANPSETDSAGRGRNDAGNRRGLQQRN